MRWRRALAAGLVGVVATAAVAADDADRRAALERARTLVTEALVELRAERADEAAQLLSRARSTAPGEPVVLYDHGLALAAADRVDEARDAYREALRQTESSVSDVARRARHNLALSHLRAARDVEALLRTPGALEDAVRAAGAPGGEPLTPDTVTMLASELRSKAIDDGLQNARAAIEALRDSVRTRPDDADAVRNLVLAQRARRYLEEEQRRQTEQESRRQDEGDEGAGDEQQEQPQGDQGGEGEDGEQEQQDPAGGEDDEQQARQEPGEQGESTDASSESSATRHGAPRDLGREQAERLLEQLLDAAALKARQVERMRAERLRKGAVEKDW